MSRASQTPVAAFSASPTSGKVPLNIKFADKSKGSPTKVPSQNELCRFSIGRFDFHYQGCQSKL
uniref:Uncharacterized protein n=1 Tax=Methanosarcina barkeri (strain Fusaro / DSM 804) TaxID=269797 RepID=Q468U5_METBF